MRAGGDAVRVAAFDLDGTLIDTAPDLIGAVNAVLAAEGARGLDPEGDRSAAGRGGRAMLRLGLERAGRAAVEAGVERLLPAFLESYAARLAAETRLFPGARDALDALAADGGRLAVCTNKPHALALALLDALGDAGRFAAVLGADAAPAPKPDPAHLSAVVARAGGRLSATVMIGDTVADLEAARRAGARCVLARYGYADRPVETLGADALISDLRELPAILSRLSPGPA